MNWPPPGTIPVLCWALILQVINFSFSIAGHTTADSSNPFLFIFHLATFTSVDGMAWWVSLLCFITSTLPLLLTLFGPVLFFVSVATGGAASNSLGGQIVIAGTIVAVIAGVIGLLFAFLS